MDQAINNSKLTEEELEAVSGGIAWAVGTEDRHDPDICSTFTEMEHRCLGLLTKTPCVHYSPTSNFDLSGGPITMYYKCLMGHFYIAKRLH